MTPFAYFKSQFPNETIDEISHARYCTEKKKYVDFNLDIDWSLYIVNIEFTRDNRRVHIKECFSSIYCTNSECRFFGLDVRPASSFKLCCLICEKQSSQKGYKAKVKMVKRSEFLGEFGKIEKEFDGFIQSAEVASSKFCIIFAAPELKYDLPFDAYPIVTDVTHNSVEDGYYLCSSVLYIPVLNKHLVIYQTIIGGLETRYFTKYFESLFKHFEINLEKSMGVIMEFSSAQRKGFLETYERTYMKTSQPLPDGRRSLKGCYMHWMQSVEHLVSNYAVTPREQSKQFLQLVYILRTTGSYPVYIRSIIDLATGYPECKKRLKWWLQPSNASMRFRCGSFQHPVLLNHHVRTTNTIESYHSVLYGLIIKEQPLSVSLRYILSFCKNDGRMLFSFF